MYYLCRLEYNSPLCRGRKWETEPLTQNQEVHGTGVNFREMVLIPNLLNCISDNEILNLDMDIDWAFPASFLDEAFFFLRFRLKELGIKIETVADHLKIITDNKYLETEIWRIIFEGVQDSSYSEMWEVKS